MQVYYRPSGFLPQHLVTGFVTGFVGALILASSLILTATPASAQTVTPPAPPTAPAAPTAVPKSGAERRILRGDRPIRGENFTLESDETLRGDLTIFGGNATLEEGSRLEGELNILGGNADVAGTITKDVSIVGGSLRLRPTARVEGSIAKIGGSVMQDPGAYVAGRTTEMPFPRLPRVPNLSGDFLNQEDRSAPRFFEPFRFVFNTLGGAFAAIVGAILITLIAVAIVAIFPRNVEMAAETAVNQWAASGGLGVLTVIAGAIVLVLMVITICLIPFALVLGLVYAVAMVAGWSVSARIVGERLMKAFNRADWTLVGQVAAGAILVALLGSIPLIGWLVGLIATSLGLGALLLTRFGVRPYPAPPTPAMAGFVAPYSPSPPPSPTSPMRPAPAPPAPPSSTTPPTPPTASESPMLPYEPPSSESPGESPGESPKE